MPYFPEVAFFTLASDWVCEMTLEVLRRQAGQWLLVAVHEGSARVSAEPFDAIELDLGPLWGEAER